MDEHLYTEISRQCQKRIEILVKKKEKIQDKKDALDKEFNDLYIIRDEYDNIELQRRLFKHYRTQRYIKTQKKLLKKKIAEKDN